MKLLRSFFVPDVPAGYWPGELALKIAERDLTSVECPGDGTPSTLECRAGTIRIREKVKRNFLQFTAVPVFELGDAKGDLKAEIHHTGSLKRTGIDVRGDPEFTDPLSDPSISKALLPLDFTRLELFGSVDGFRLEIETFGASHVVMRLPRVRRYVPLGAEQSGLLIGAFETISRVLVASAGQKK